MKEKNNMKRGRKKISKHLRKVVVSITLNPYLLREIKQKGNVSAFIQKALMEYIKN